jgi:hypothetical protein
LDSTAVRDEFNVVSDQFSPFLACFSHVAFVCCLPVQLTNEWMDERWVRAEVLREFASKRHVKLSRVTIRAKDDEEEVKPAGTKHRRRRTSGDRRGGGERKESDRSLAKVHTPRPRALHDTISFPISNHLIRGR